MSIFSSRSGLPSDQIVGQINGINAMGRLISAVAPIARADAAGRQMAADAFDDFLQKHSPLKAAVQAAARADASRRNDSVAGGVNGGLFMQRQLEVIATRVLSQPLPELNALRLFPISTEVAPGALTYTVRRVYERGSASVWRGGQQRIPRATLTQREEQVPVRHLVDAFEWSLFEQQSADFANFSLIERGMSAARRAIAELHNELLWFGSSADGVNGVLNYPWLDEKVVATEFTASATAADMIAEIMALIAYPSNNSRGTFAPTDVVMSIKLYNFLMQTPVSVSNGSNVTLLQFIAQNNPARIPLDRFHQAQELNDCGPAGEQGIFLYRKDQDAIRAIVVQPTTTLPLQQVGFQNTQYMYSSIGGLLMADVGNNILGYITVTE